jgi:hypothetical protein
MTDRVAAAPPPAQAEYTARRDDRRRRADDLLRRYRRAIGLKNKVPLLMAAILFEELNAPPHPAVILLMLGLAAVLGALQVWANRITLAWRRADRAARYYDGRLAVLAGQWAGRGDTGQRYLDDHHPYGRDLDLFGDGSLYELLSTAHTRAGQDTLAAWLRHPAAAAEVAERQAAVDALRGRLDLREALNEIAGEWPAGEDRAALDAWVAQPSWPGLDFARRSVAALCILALPAVVLGLAAGLGGWVVLTLLVLLGGSALVLRHRVHATLAPVEPYAPTIAVYADVLARWERESVGPPVRAEPLRQLARRLSWLRVIPLAAPVLGQTQLALAVESWRRRHGPDLAGWLDAAGRAEALCSLATYAFENPADPFPEIVEPGPCVDGRALAHPLMPRGTCVPNDLMIGREPRIGLKSSPHTPCAALGTRSVPATSAAGTESLLGRDLQLLVVSGSNMSGKSTFLRTVGVNAVLALAGAPVRAGRLRISPLAIGATLRVQDSLLRGQSRFYAEITRLRQILDLAKGPVPVLFLLDELLSGTNSEDRRAGAEAVLRRLVDTGAIGLVTTHDLALTSVADGLGPAGANVHFDERLEGDRLAFDYTMRPGVVRQRNALALMRAVGINV